MDLRGGNGMEECRGDGGVNGFDDKKMEVFEIKMGTGDRNVNRNRDGDRKSRWNCKLKQEGDG